MELEFKAGFAAHVYVYGCEPPDTFTDAVPLFPPKQLTSVEEFNETTIAVCGVIVTLALIMQF